MPALQPAPETRHELQDSGLCPHLETHSTIKKKKPARERNSNNLLIHNDTLKRKTYAMLVMFVGYKSTAHSSEE